MVRTVFHDKEYFVFEKHNAKESIRSSKYQPMHENEFAQK